MNTRCEIDLPCSIRAALVTQWTSAGDASRLGLPLCSALTVFLLHIDALLVIRAGCGCGLLLARGLRLLRLGHWRVLIIGIGSLRATFLKTMLMELTFRFMPNMLLKGSTPHNLTLPLDGVGVVGASPLAAASFAKRILVFSLSTMTWTAFLVRPGGSSMSFHGIEPCLAMIWNNRPIWKVA